MNPPNYYLENVLPPPYNPSYAPNAQIVPPPSYVSNSHVVSGYPTQIPIISPEYPAYTAYQSHMQNQTLETNNQKAYVPYQYYLPNQSHGIQMNQYPPTQQYIYKPTKPIDVTPKPQTSCCIIL